MIPSTLPGRLKNTPEASCRRVLLPWPRQTRVVCTQACYISLFTKPTQNQQSLLLQQKPGCHQLKPLPFCHFCSETDYVEMKDCIRGTGCRFHTGEHALSPRITVVKKGAVDPDHEAGGRNKPRCLTPGQTLQEVTPHHTAPAENRTEQGVKDTARIQQPCSDNPGNKEKKPT